MISVGVLSLNLIQQKSGRWSAKLSQTYDTKCLSIKKNHLNACVQGDSFLLTIIRQYISLAQRANIESKQSGDEMECNFVQKKFLRPVYHYNVFR